MKTVAAAVITINGKLLLCRRSAGEKLAGMWEFPGGKLEKGETPARCVVRELREELGIDSEAGEIIGKSIYRYDHGEFELVGIEAVPDSLDFRLSVHDCCRWFSPDEIEGLELAPADIPLVRIAARKISGRPADPHC